MVDDSTIQATYLELDQFDNHELQGRISNLTSSTFVEMAGGVNAIKSGIQLDVEGHWDDGFSDVELDDLFPQLSQQEFEFQGTATVQNQQLSVNSFPLITTPMTDFEEFYTLSQVSGRVSVSGIYSGGQQLVLEVEPTDYEDLIDPIEQQGKWKRQIHC